MLRLSAAEGKRRHQAIRDALRKSEYATYIIFDRENFIYATNFLLDVEPWERPVAAIFPADDSPLLILNELSYNHFNLALERRTCWVADAEFYIEHPRLMNRIPTIREWDALFIDVLRRRRLTRGVIAVDRLDAISRTIREALPDVTFRLDPDIVRDLRLVKSEEELNLLRNIGELTDWAQAQYKSLVAPGEYIFEVNLEMARRFGRYVVERYPEEHVEVHVLGDTGPVDTACPHGPGANSGRRIEKGHGILNIILCRINGYWVENERTLFVGEPSPEQKRCFNLMAEAQAATVAAMVEGGRIADIDSAGQRVYEAAGMGDYVFHRSGHGIGIGGHEYPHDTAFNYRPLVAGMVFSAEPALFVPGVGGFRHSDTVIVGKEAPEPVTRYSKRLEDLIIPC